MKYFKGTHVGILGMFDHKNASGCQLASVGPRKLTKMIKFYILSMGMGFDYSKNHHQLYPILLVQMMEMVISFIFSFRYPNSGLY